MINEQLSIRENKNSYIPANADETHVHDAGGACEHITGDVHVTPHHAQWPVTCGKHFLVHLELSLQRYR